MTPLRHADVMIRTATRFMCIECGVDHAKWAGQCTTCVAWNTVVEASVEAIADSPLAQLAPLVRLDDVDAAAGGAHPTGIGELDRVLGGGLVAGSVTLLGGEPGIGKSTLVLQLLARDVRARRCTSAPRRVRSR